MRGTTMKHRWLRTVGLAVVAALLVLGLFGTSGSGSKPAGAQILPNGCPAGFIMTSNGCVSFVNGGFCPIGVVPTAGGCLPQTFPGGCPFGFIPTTGGCLPNTLSGTCPGGFVLAP